MRIWQQHSGWHCWKTWPSFSSHLYFYRANICKLFGQHRPWLHSKKYFLWFANFTLSMSRTPKFLRKLKLPRFIKTRLSFSFVFCIFLGLGFQQLWCVFQALTNPMSLWVGRKNRRGPISSQWKNIFPYCPIGGSLLWIIWPWVLWDFVNSEKCA